MSSYRYQQYWEELGELDPYWAILSNPKYRFGRWDVAEFFRSGEVDAAMVMEWVARHGRPVRRALALDYGCGVGRLTRALAKYFTRVVGLDISSIMLSRARELNAQVHNCEFEFAESGLVSMADASCDLVYCALVLQHIPLKSAREQVIRDFVRVLEPNGLLIFQLPHFIPLPYSLQPTRKLYGLLRRAGLSSHFIYHRLRLQPISNYHEPEEEVRALLEAQHASVLEVLRFRSLFVQDRIYLVTRE